MPDQTRAARLRQARLTAGYARPTDALEAFGWNRSTYFGHENGSRGISLARIRVYADAFRVLADWLAYGQGQMRSARRIVRIEGHIGSLGMIEELESADFEQIELPPGTPDRDDFVAFKVRGNENYPVWEEGDVVFVPRRHGPAEDYIGKRCLITLGDGSRLISKLMRGSRNGLFILLSFSGPPMVDIEIAEASPLVSARYS